ncbi:hypothetical protein, partial [Vibrio cholerae]|uniref:hypothetical protein n=1 Tax=Vibrio cholerae TaxID=666 RepID=UPI001C117F81
MLRLSAAGTAANIRAKSSTRASADIFAHGYAENAETIARRAWNKRSYIKATTPEPTDPTPSKHTEEENTAA